MTRFLNPSLVTFRKNDAGAYVPVLFPTDEVPAIEQALNYLETRLGQSFASAREQFPRDICQGIRFSRILEEVLFSRFYIAQNDSLPELEGRNVRDLRVSVFDLVNEQFGGFILPSTWPAISRIGVGAQPRSHEAVLAAIRQKYNLPQMSVGDLLRALFQDHLVNLQLVRNTPTRVHTQEVRDAINHSIIDTALRTAKTLFFPFQKLLTGTQYRRLQFIINRTGLYGEFLQENAPCDIGGNISVTLAIHRPEQVIGRTGNLALHMVAIFHYICKRYSDLTASLHPSIIIERKKRDMRVLLESSPTWLPGPQFPPDLETTPLTFDSTVEEDLFAKLKGMGALMSTIVRDAEIIIIPPQTSESSTPPGQDYVMIPDFQVKFHGESLFIEVIGFWTEQYKTRKFTRLNLLPPIWHDKLILLVDEAINAPQTPFPTFTYDKKHFPLQKLQDFIQQWELRIYKPVASSLQATFLQEIQRVIHEKGWFTLSEARNHWRFERMAEARRFLDDMLASPQFDTMLARAGETFVTREKVSAWLEHIKQSFTGKNRDHMRKQDLLKHLPADLPGSLVDAVLQLGGYKISYQNLIDVVIIPPRISTTEVPKTHNP